MHLSEGESIKVRSALPSSVSNSMGEKDGDPWTLTQVLWLLHSVCQEWCMLNKTAPGHLLEGKPHEWQGTEAELHR